MLQALSFIFLSFFLSACQSLTPNSSEFAVQRLWVRDLVDSHYLKQKKIHRGTPVVVGQRIIQSNGIDGVVALDKDTGNQLWKVNITNGVEAGMAYDSESIYFGSSDGFFYSVQLKTGEKNWSFPTRVENIGSPLFYKGMVYFLSGNNAFYALDAKTGKQIWLYSRIEATQFSIRGASEPVVDNDIIYVGFSDGALVSFNSQTGSVIWEKSINKNKKFKDVDSKIVIDRDRLYVSGYDEALYCLDKNTSNVIWKVNEGGFYPVTLQADKVYYSTTQDSILVIDAKNGNVEQNIRLKQGIGTQVVLYKDFMVFGETSGSLSFYNMTKKMITHEYDPGRGIYSVPFIDEKNENVYFISNEGYLYKLKAAYENKKIFSWL